MTKWPTEASACDVTSPETDTLSKSAAVVGSTSSSKPVVKRSGLQRGMWDHMVCDDACDADEPTHLPQQIRNGHDMARTCNMPQVKARHARTAKGAKHVFGSKG